MRERRDALIHALEAAHFALAATLVLSTDPACMGRLQEADDIVTAILNHLIDEDEL